MGLLISPLHAFSFFTSKNVQVSHPNDVCYFEFWQPHMEIDPRICSQARLSRDARFDGRFFIGVRTTRIYCRSICPVRAAKEENVRYFPTAAAAADAGYRPCLRCRPELSPGTPAWLGTTSTVSCARYGMAV